MLFLAAIFVFLLLVFQFNLGLIMLIGIIMYISLFKSEVGSKLRPRSMFQSPLFTYRYGHSFILFVIGCISAEIVGTLNFFLFIQIREIGREKVSFNPKNWFSVEFFLPDTCIPIFEQINWEMCMVHFWNRSFCGAIVLIIFLVLGDSMFYVCNLIKRRDRWKAN